MSPYAAVKSWHTNPIVDEHYYFDVGVTISDVDGEVPPDPFDIVLRMTLKDIQSGTIDHEFDTYFQMENRCDLFTVVNSPTNPVFEIDESTFTEPITFADPTALIVDITHFQYKKEEFNVCGGWQMTTVCEDDDLADYIEVDPFTGTLTVNTVGSDGTTPLQFQDGTFQCITTFKYPMDASATSQADIPFLLSLTAGL